MAWDDIPDWALVASRSIMEMVSLKDNETFLHCMRVGNGARLLAEAAGLNEYETRVIEFAGMFHDAGKVGVPDQILLKPAKLTEEEYAVMRAHPVKSAQIIEPFAQNEFFKALLPGVLHHHERIDGRGYPYGLSGDDIPLAARIILIVDTFDAMTKTRSYRAALSPEVAYQELREFAGRQFDSHLVKIFLEAHPRWVERSDEVRRETEATVFKIAV